MSTSRRVLVMPVVSIAVLLGGCTTALPADTRAADEQSIRTLDAEWVKAAQSKRADAWVAFYSDDAAVLPPNEPMAADKNSITKSVSGLLSLAGLTISW